MKSHAIGAVFITVLASAVALYLGSTAAALAFFLLAVSPLPFSVGFAVTDRLVALRRR